MYILTLRTDKPGAELGLYDDRQQLGYIVWQAHRQLAETLHSKADSLLTAHNIQLKDLNGLVVYKGPGSFTGLRIGISTANALAYSFSIPIVAGSDQWIEDGITRLLNGETDTIALPEYGAPAFTTTPRK